MAGTFMNHIDFVPIGSKRVFQIFSFILFISSASTHARIMTINAGISQGGIYAITITKHSFPLLKFEWNIESRLWQNLRIVSCDFCRDAAAAAAGRRTRIKNPT